MNLSRVIRISSYLVLTLVLVLVIFLSLGVVRGVTAATNVLTNGSFETGNNPPTGWTVGGPTGIDVVSSSGWAPSQGSYSIDLNAFDPGTISQTFATYSGGSYTVTFDLAGNPGHGGVVTLQVSAAATVLNFTFDTTGHTTTSMGWTPKTFNFTANSTSTTLTFTSLTSGASSCPIANACGPALDNIAVWYTNQAPVLTVVGTATYTEDAPPVVVAPGLTLVDVENDNINGAKGSIGAGFNVAEDSLGVQGPLPAGITSSYNSGTGVLTLSGTASPASYQQALRQVTFSNNSQNPAATPRTVTFNIGSTLASSNGHFYEFVSSGGITWMAAQADAQTRSLYGLQGYLATITSQAENDFILAKVQGNGWLGGTDQTTEGTWVWVTGPEAGTVFCIGTGTCVPQGGAYTHWNGGEPNNAGNEDYLHMIGNAAAGPLGTWNDLPLGGGGGAYYVLGYIVEFGGMPGDPALQLSGDVTVNVVPVNDPPTANAGGPYTVNEGSSVTLHGTGSDVDSSTLTYAWDLDNNGSFETAGQDVSFAALDGPASPIVRLRVCDTGTPLPSLCTTSSPTITVNNVAPSLVIAGANTVYYVDWTAANPGAGTASGVITLPDASTINVTFQAVGSTFLGAQTSGGTNFWNPSAPYISAQVPNAPPTPDILQLVGGTNTVYQVTLSQPIVDPIMAIVSLGSGSNTMTYNFNSPFTIVSQGNGYFGGCATCLVQLPGNVLQGTEGHGTIKFLGTYSTFSWTVPNPEVWHGFTFGVRSSSALASTIFVNEGQTATNSGTWSDPGVNDNVVLSASVGQVTKIAGGTWTWSLATTDGPAQTQTVNITATDKDGASTSKSFPLVVNNVAPTATFTNNGPVNEGSSFTLSLTNPVDPSSVDAASLQYAFDCGDGSSYSPLGASSSRGCSTTDNGIRSVKGKVQDKDGGLTEYNANVTVNNVAPANLTLTATPGAINENDTTTLSGSFTDPGTLDTHTVVIDWGDGSTTTTLSLAGNVLTFSAPHQYLDNKPANAPYTVNVIVTDKDGGTGSGPTTITVNNVAPTATFNVPPIVGGVTPLIISLTNPSDPSSADTAAGFQYAFDCDNGSGYGAFSSSNSTNCSTTLDGSHTVKGKIKDKDGGFTEYTAVVLVDRTPPEAYNQFGPVTKDVLVFGRDSGSGVPAGPIAPISIVPVKWGSDDDGEDDNKSKDSSGSSSSDKDKDKDEKESKAELRTYKITDAAGNTLILVEKVKIAGHEIKVHIVSLRYNNGPVITPPKNKKSFEWSTEKDGSLKELEQEMEVGKGKNKKEVEAKFEGKKNQTTIKIDEPKPETKIVKPGLVLLRMATNKGNLVIEY